jgi:hypothetical protein
MNPYKKATELQGRKVVLSTLWIDVGLDQGERAGKG